MKPRCWVGSEAGITLDSRGNLFGTTYAGGTNNVGTLFEIAHGTTVITTITNSTNTNGANPKTAVTLDSSGNLFGTTYQGGPGGYGTVFELSPTPPTISFTTPPALATTGSALNGTTGIQVGVLHLWGNLYTADSSTVTLTLSGGTFADGSTTKTAATVNGVATFTLSSADRNVRGFRPIEMSGWAARGLAPRMV